MVPNSLLKQSMKKIAEIEGVKMDATWLAIDILTLSFAFPDKDQFIDVVDCIIVAIKTIVEHPEVGEELERELIGNRSYHFSSSHPQEENEVDMRAVYKIAEKIILKGFGHRYIPESFYLRLIGRV